MSKRKSGFTRRTGLWGQSKKPAGKAIPSRLRSGRRQSTRRGLSYEALEPRALLATLQHSLFPDLGPEASMNTGESVATDANFHVVGSPGAIIGGAQAAGMVRVFNASTGALIATITNPSPDPLDDFGSAVAVSGNIVIVGAQGDDTGATSSGRAYAFNATTGALIRTFDNPAPGVGDSFGSAVAISGNTVVIGAPIDEAESDAFPGFTTEAGRVFVFDVTNGAPIATLKSQLDVVLNGTPRFGHAVAIGSNMIVIGAYNGGIPGVGGQVETFNASTGAFIGSITNLAPAASGDQFGFSVAISGNAIAVGAPGDDAGATDSGHAYVFNATTRVLISTLANPSPAAGDQFGISVGIAGNTAVVSSQFDDDVAVDNGAAYLFNATTGLRLATLTNPTSASADQFGSAVAISTNRVLVGARADDTGANNAGRAHIFSPSNGAFVATLDNPRPPVFGGEQFGVAVSVSGDKVAVGAYLTDTFSPNNGRAYIYDRNTGLLLTTLSNPSSGEDWFGYSIAISGNIAVVGAIADDPNDTGRAYVFNAMSGAHLFTLQNPTPDAGDQFGVSVGLSGNLIVVGAYLDDTNGTDSGRAYVFNATTGALVATLANPNPAAGDRFGGAVAISGNTVVVGAYSDDATGADSGTAYLFNATTGALLAVVNNPTPASGDQFGYAVAISGGTILVGALTDDAGATNSGAAHLFNTSGGLIATITNPSPGAGDQFGSAVAIDGNTAIVGALADDTGGTNSGRAYAFNATTGALTATIANPTSAANDDFGNAVAISGTTVVVGALLDDTQNSDQGAAYVFSQGQPPTVTVNQTTVTSPEGAAITNGGSYNDSDGGNVSFSVLTGPGAVTKTGSSSGTWTWTYTPPDGPAGPITVVIRADDGDGGIVDTSFVLNVGNVGPSVTNAGPVTVNEGSPAVNAGTWSDPGVDDVTLTASVGAVTRNAGGTWSWSLPTVDGPDQSQTVTITATDSDGATATTSFTLTVNNAAPIVSSAGNVTTGEGATAVNTGTWSDPGADVVTLSASVGAVIKNIDNTWSWSYPTTDGPDQSQLVTITATDSDGLASSTTFTLTVNNAAPFLVIHAATVTVSEGATASNTGTFGDFGADAVTLSASVGSIVDHGDGTWSWSYPTTDGPDQSQTVTITATDSDGAPNTATFQLVVNNAAPTVAADNASVAVSEGATAHNSGTLGDVGADTVTLAASVGAIVDNGNGTWSWSFTPTDGPDDSQTVTITATDSDGVAATTSFALVVNNLAPTVAADNASISASEGAIAGNTGTYGDAGADGITLAASVGAIVDNGDGTWSWSYPTSDGPDQSQTVTITATDSDGVAATTTFTLTVNNAAPFLIIHAATVTVGEGATASNTGTYGDFGADVVTLSASVGAIVDNGDGTWSWSYPTTDGPDQTQIVTITATDSDGAPNTATFQLVVNNAAPTVSADQASVAAGEGATATNTGTYSDAGADAVTLSASVGAIVDNGDGTWNWSYTPADGPDDSQTVTITATDSDGLAATTTFGLNVANLAPTVAADNSTVTVSEGATAANTGTYGDAGADVVTLAASVGTIVDNGDGTWSWSYPTADGPDDSQTVTITATDSDGLAASTTFALTVNNLAPAVGADNATVAVTEGSTATNTGTIADAGADGVLLSASIGTITDNGNGTWNWSYPTTDGPDQSQTVTITATDSDGASTSTTFALVVNNVAPTVAVDNASVSVSEGATASNTGSFADTGADSVTLSASLGTIINNGNGTWSWSYPTTDGPDQSQLVTITATDSDGLASSTTFTLTVNNAAPFLVIHTGSVTVSEGATATNTGTFGDFGADAVTLSASVGTIVDHGDGTWSWSYPTTDGPDQSQTVTITATDSDGAPNTATFQLVVNNAAPTVAADNASVAVSEGATAGNTGTWTDAGADVVTLSASVGAVIKNIDGTWNWSYSTADGPDQSQTVTITATDSDGLASTTTFGLVVNNVAPTVAATNSSVTLSEGATATNTGAYGDVGADTVTLSASIGAVVANGNGTWSWSYGTSDGPVQSQNVTITATDSDGLTTSTSFALLVNNIAPTLSVASASVTVSEGQTATNSGMWGDVPADVVSLSASRGTVTKNANGTWNWSYIATDDLPTTTVTVTATDDDGGQSQVSFTLKVNNLPPTITSLSAPGWANPGSQGGQTSLSGSFADVPADTHVATVNWGDGSPVQSLAVNNAADTFAGSHSYQAGGEYTITVVLTDDDGAATTQSTTAVVSGAGLRSDGTLQIIGTSANDVGLAYRLGSQLIVQATFLPRQFAILPFGTMTFPLSQVQRIWADFGDGNDVFAIADDVTVSTLLRGGSGNDALTGGGGLSLLLGGDGNDLLYGGKGRGILIGGRGKDALLGGDNEDVLIGGSSNLDANDAGLAAVLSTWGGNGAYATRVASLSMSLSDINDAEPDQLVGGDGRDLFYAAVGDHLLDQKQNGSNKETAL